MILELLGLKKPAFDAFSLKWLKISLGWYSKNRLDMHLDLQNNVYLSPKSGPQTRADQKLNGKRSTTIYNTVKQICNTM